MRALSDADGAAMSPFNGRFGSAPPGAPRRAACPCFQTSVSPIMHLVTPPSPLVAYASHRSLTKFNKESLNQPGGFKAEAVHLKCLT